MLLLSTMWLWCGCYLCISDFLLSMIFVDIVLVVLLVIVYWCWWLQMFYDVIVWFLIGMLVSVVLFSGSWFVVLMLIVVPAVWKHHLCNGLGQLNLLLVLAVVAVTLLLVCSCIVVFLIIVRVWVYCVFILVCVFLCFCVVCVFFVLACLLACLFAFIVDTNECLCLLLFCCWKFRLVVDWWTQLGSWLVSSLVS